MILIRALAMSSAFVVLAACGNGAPATETARGDRSVMAFGELSTVSVTDSLLEVHGPMGTVHLDHAGLEHLGLQTVTVDEPFELRAIEFRGVWLRDLLMAVGGRVDDTVRIHALDDYEVDLAMSDLPRSTALLVTANGDGTRIGLTHGGPIRLVFTDDSPVGTNADLWIWSIDRIAVG